MHHKLTRYKDIIYYRTLASLKSESKRNYLGYLWLLIDPSITVLILYLVFGIIMNHRGTDFVLFLVIGLTNWQWFDNSINEGIRGIRDKIHILQQIPLEKFIFPIVQISIASVKHGFVYSIVILLTLIFGYKINFNYFYLPLILFTQLILIIGITLPLSIFFSYLEDVGKFISLAMRLLFYLSGIFFSSEQVPEHLKHLFYLNPIARLIEAHRNVLILNTPPELNLIMYPLFLGVILTSIGLIFCNHIDKSLLKSISV